MHSESGPAGLCEWPIRVLLPVTDVVRGWAVVVDSSPTRTVAVISEQHSSASTAQRSRSRAQLGAGAIAFHGTTAVTPTNTARACVCVAPPSRPQPIPAQLRVELLFPSRRPRRFPVPKSARLRPHGDGGGQRREGAPGPDPPQPRRAHLRQAPLRPRAPRQAARL